MMWMSKDMGPSLPRADAIVSASRRMLAICGYRMTERMRIFTIGYEGATMDEFLAALKARGSSG